VTLVYPADDFEAFLTAVLETWLNRSPEWTIAAETADWFGPDGPRRFVSADPAAARRIAAGVVAHAGGEAWTVLGEAFRHRGGGKEGLLSAFIRLCILHGPNTLLRLMDPEVREIRHRARAVRAEAHRFLGLLRFQAVDGGWYGRFEPEHDVLGMLVPSFLQRFHGDDWMLHDEGRRTAWICRNGEGRPAAGVKMLMEGKEPQESAVQELWKRYFKVTAQPTRINASLQRNKLPLKTWKNLVEEPGRF
jgi:probable DNA metabolism protein